MARKLTFQEFKNACWISTSGSKKKMFTVAAYGFKEKKEYRTASEFEAQLYGSTTTYDIKWAGYKYLIKAYEIDWPKHDLLTTLYDWAIHKQIPWDSFYNKIAPSDKFEWPSGIIAFRTDKNEERFYWNDNLEHMERYLIKKPKSVKPDHLEWLTHKKERGESDVVQEFIQHFKVNNNTFNEILAYWGKIYRKPSWYYERQYHNPK